MELFWLKNLYFAGNAVFDASQYAFFGKDVLEEVELGGLEDEEDELPPAEYDDEEEIFFGREEVTYFSLLINLSHWCENLFNKFVIHYRKPISF